MERPQQHRSKSSFSGMSEKTHRSKNSISRESEEKRRSHMPTGKANPNAAMNEAQPIAAALEQPTLQSLRSFTHVDIHGNPIPEPDLSNPTRPRWERPLDTIRSFEAAIDTEYKRRSIIRTDSAPDGQSAVQSRRSSFYGGPNDRAQPRFAQMGGHYGNGNGNGNGQSNGHFRDPSAEHNYGPPSSRSRHPQRLPSEPMNGRQTNGNQMYPNAGYHQSRDTVNTGGSGSGSEPWANNTDPNSDNGSFERSSATRFDQINDQSGYARPGGGPVREQYGQEANYSHPHLATQAYPSHTAPANYPDGTASLPPVPPKHGAERRPIPLDRGAAEPLSASNGNASRPRTLAKNNSDSGDKRKSWFKRKFSKD